MARAAKTPPSPTKEAIGISIWLKPTAALMDMELPHLMAVHLVWKRSRKSRFLVMRRIATKGVRMVYNVKAGLRILIYFSNYEHE